MEPATGIRPKKPAHADTRRVLHAFEQAYARAKDGDELRIAFARSGRFVIREFTEKGTDE